MLRAGGAGVQGETPEQAAERVCSDGVGVQVVVFCGQGTPGAVGIEALSLADERAYEETPGLALFCWRVCGSQQRGAELKVQWRGKMGL